MSFSLSVTFARVTRGANRSVVFQPRPGERVRLDLTVKTSVTLPAGELIIAPNWDHAGEQRAWGMAFALNYRQYFKLAFLVGVAMLAAGVIVGYRGAA